MSGIKFGAYLKLGYVQNIMIRHRCFTSSTIFGPVPQRKKNIFDCRQVKITLVFNVYLLKSYVGAKRGGNEFILNQKMAGGLTRDKMIKKKPNEIESESKKQGTATVPEI